MIKADGGDEVMNETEENKTMTMMGGVEAAGPAAKAGEDHMTISMNSDNEEIEDDGDVQMIDMEAEGRLDKPKDDSMSIEIIDEPDDSLDNIFKKKKKTMNEQQERQRRLEQEATLRIGYGVGFNNSDDEDIDGNEDGLDHSKKHSSHNKKKKSKSKKQQPYTEERLKQTRLIFTPKEQKEQLLGKKRHPESRMIHVESDD